MSFPVRRIPDGAAPCSPAMIHVKGKRPPIVPPDPLERYLNPREKKPNLRDPDSLPAFGHALIKALGLDLEVSGYCREHGRE